MKKQITGTIMMLRPSGFGFNEETARSNHFQDPEGKDDNNISELAMKEFDEVARQLKAHGIEVMVIEDDEKIYTPDAIFPNNWITTHDNKILVTYAMESAVRRHEIREDILVMLEEKYGYNKRYNFEHYTEENLFLEGTGSIILDRENKILYACLSPRTHIELISKFNVLMGYRSIYFYAEDLDGNLIYHTNVMMALGEELAIICLEAIKDEDKRKEVVLSLKNTGKEIIDISLNQVHQFAGNMLELRAIDGQRLLCMSSQAYNSLTEKQIAAIENYDKILHLPIPTIEKYGGGSIRCMMAEIFAPNG